MCRYLEKKGFRGVPLGYLSIRGASGNQYIDHVRVRNRFLIPWNHYRRCWWNTIRPSVGAPRTLREPSFLSVSMVVLVSLNDGQYRLELSLKVRTGTPKRVVRVLVKLGLLGTHTVHKCKSSGSNCVHCMIWSLGRPYNLDSLWLSRN